MVWPQGPSLPGESQSLFSSRPLSLMVRGPFNHKVSCPTWEKIPGTKIKTSMGINDVEFIPPSKRENNTKITIPTIQINKKLSPNKEIIQISNLHLTFLQVIIYVILLQKMDFKQLQVTLLLLLYQTTIV